MTRGPEKQFDPQRALFSAMKVFWAKGYHASGLTELLTAMGIGRKSLYDTFGDKRALFLKSLDLYAETIIHRIIEVIEKPGPPLDSICSALEFIDQQNGKKVSNGCLLGVGMAQFRSDETDVAQVLCTHLGKLENAYAQRLTEAKELGHLPASCRPRDLARTLTAITQGLTLIRRVNESPAMSRSIIRGTLEMLEALGAQ